MKGDGNVGKNSNVGCGFQGDDKILINMHVYDTGKIKAFRKEKKVQKSGASLEDAVSARNEKF